MVTLLIRGGSVELSERESFAKVKGRIQKAKKMLEDYRLGNADELDTIGQLTFYTDMGDGDEGRIAMDVNDVFGCMSDTRTDRVAKSDDDETQDEG